VQLTQHLQTLVNSSTLSTTGNEDDPAVPFGHLGPFSRFISTC
jgi:hypothetical protein